MEIFPLISLSKNSERHTLLLLFFPLYPILHIISKRQMYEWAFCGILHRKVPLIAHITTLAH